VLLGADEADDRPAHPLISHVPVPPLHVGQLAAFAAHDGDDAATIAALRSMAVTTAQPVSRGVRDPRR